MLQVGQQSENNGQRVGERWIGFRLGVSVHESEALHECLEEIVSG